MPEDELQSFVEAVSGESHLRVEADLGDGFVRLNTSEAERRQAAHDIRSSEDVVIEMLRNARDAHARNIFLALSRTKTQRRLVIVDDGDGVPPALHKTIFEPRVTSKLDSVHEDKWGIHGRGMALYSIAVNATSACVAASQNAYGSSFVVETDLQHLTEKTDQSSFPVFEANEEGSVLVRGPKNILRTACEFALDCRNTCTLYLGSVTDIASTLYAFGLSSLSVAARAFSSEDHCPLCKRLCFASDPASLVEKAAQLGLILSERSARRIIDKEIAPLDPLIERIHIRNAAGKKASHSKAYQHKLPSRAGEDARGLKFAPNDLDALASGVATLYSDIAQRYFLEPDVKPLLRIDKDAIRIVIPVLKVR